MEADIRIRLQQMVQANQQGRNAEILLQQLSIFLTERFGWPAIALVAPTMRPLEQSRAIEILEEGQFLQRRSGLTYQIDPIVSAALQPSPSEDEQFFAVYAARILRKFSTTISKKTLETYVKLVGWCLQHKPDFGFALAEMIAPKFGGADPRFYELIFQAAQRLNRFESQVKVLVKLGDMAFKRNQLDRAAELYQTALDVPASVESNTNYLRVRALEFLGHVARLNGQWSQARAVYERTLVLREQIKPQSRRPMYLFVWLCYVTTRQGDQAGHDRYALKLREDLFPSKKAVSDIARHRLFFVQYMTAWGRFRSNGTVLWRWGWFEYLYGDRQAGYALCQMALLDMEAEFEKPQDINPMLNRHSLFLQNRWQYIEELKAGLAALNGEGC